MRLKQDKNRTPTTCDYARCSCEEGLVGYGPGIVADSERGMINLCSKHAEEREREKEAARPAALAVVTPPAAPDSGADQQALMQEASEAKDILALVEKFEIVAQADMDFADSCLGEVKGKLKTLKAMREEATRPMNEALKKVRSWFAPAEDFYTRAEGIWKRKISAFQIVQAEAQRKALAAVQVAHAAGDTKAVAQAMTVAAQTQVELPKSLSVREAWAFEVINPDLVPREYCSPDATKLRQAVGASKGQIEIPGVTVRREDVVVKR